MIQKLLSNLFSKIKVQRQLYLIFFLSIFIPILTIGTYLIFSTRNMLYKHYEQQVYSDNLRIRSLLLNITSEIHYSSTLLGSDKELLNILYKNWKSKEDAMQALTDYDGINLILSQNAAIKDISIYTTNSSLPNSKYIHPVTKKIENTSWYQRIFSSATSFWTEEMEIDSFQNKQPVLCLHSRIFLPQTQSFAVLNVKVSTNHIKNCVENSSLTTVLWLNNSGIFYSTNKDNANRRLYAYKPKNGSTYTGRIALDKKQNHIIGCVSSLSTVLSDDIFYAASLNDEGYAYINQITIIHITILLLILLFTTIFISIYTRYFSHRVVTLRETMHNVSHGNYLITDSFSGKDEISEVFADLNIMVQNIIRKEAAAYQSQIRNQELVNQQQQMEFKILTSQINPHFLYNTLETIRMRSLKAGNREVATAIKLLGKFMRYVLDNSTTSFTSLSKELDYISTYLAIQKLRFHDRVNYSLKVIPDEDLSQYQILPLLLQPIVENAILHGLEETEQNGKIIIHIRLLQKTLHISIFDNGCGMTPEEQDNLLSHIYSHPKESSKSIGLYNIYHRIQLCYGKNYGMQIQSKKDYGTMITLILPLQKYTGSANPVHI